MGYWKNVQIEQMGRCTRIAEIIAKKRQQNDPEKSDFYESSLELVYANERFLKACEDGLVDADTIAVLIFYANEHGLQVDDLLRNLLEYDSSSK